MKTPTRSETTMGILMIAPSLLFILLFGTWPFLQGAWLSFHRLSFAQDGPGLETHFVGLDNYIELACSQEFTTVLQNTALWVGGSVSGRIAFGITLALLLKKQAPLTKIGRTVALLPWVMPIAVAGTTWRWIFHGQWGILNHLLKQLGFIEHNIIWMSMPGFKWFYLFSLSIWKEYPLYYLVILARLQGIPGELYEAAQVDGAGGWACFRRITLPILRPILLVLLLWGIVWTITDFGNVWVLTGQGMTLSTMAYRLAFRSWHLGAGATVGMYIFLILFIFSALYIFSIRQQVDVTAE